MNHSNRSPGSKTDRKTVEKNRRDQMKSLYSTLNSLVVPTHPPRDAVSLKDQLESATNYIKSLQAKLDRMKKRKGLLERRGSSNSSSMLSGVDQGGPANVDVRMLDSELQVVLVTGVEKYQFVFTEVARVLHDEGADVVSASYSVGDQRVLHTIHSKMIGGDQSAQECIAVRISERLRKLVCDDRFIRWSSNNVTKPKNLES